MNIVNIYWSSTGNTKTMAEAISQGIQNAGKNVDTFFVTDISAEKAASYDAILLGCPAMGAEELEDLEFVPLYEALKPQLKDKKVALYGTYGWGDGEWMRLWVSDLINSGVSVFGDEGFICQEDEDDIVERCKDFGKSFVA